MLHRLRGQASIRLRRPIHRCFFAHVQLKPDMPPKKKDKGKERAKDDDIVEVDKEEQANNEALSFNGSLSNFLWEDDRQSDIFLAETVQFVVDFRES